jgi:thymidylate kinase
MLETLAAGDSIVIFPEGTRGAPGEIGHFKTEVGRLAECFPEIPTLPAFLSGPERALPRHSAVPLPIWNQVIIGPHQLFHTGCADIAAALEQMVRDLSRSETADRHRRTPRPRACMTVAVLGIDGSGKSTLSRRLAQTLSAHARVARISDSLEFYENGACATVRSLPSETLRRLLGRYAKTARSLRHYKIPKLVELLLRDHLLSEVQRWHAPAYTLMDGSPLINLMAWARLYDERLGEARVVTQAIRILIGQDDKRTNKVRDLKLPELEAMKRLGLANLAMPDVVLMLDVDPAVSMTRIRARGQRIQTHETEEKLTRLREGYLTVCDVVRSEFGIPVSVLDGSRDLDALAASAIAYVRAHRKEEKSHVERSD